jgi:hypothetical protein
VIPPCGTAGSTIFERVVQRELEDPTDRESVSPALRDASPLSPAISLPGRLMSRTPPFEGGYAGANPAPAAKFGKSSFDPLGGEIASRLAYTQQSEGQNLPERPFSFASWCNQEPSVSETGGPGAKPGEAATIPISTKNKHLAT